MSWVKKVSHANEMLKRGDTVECQVISVDEDRKRIALGLKQLKADPWEEEIPNKYRPGDVVHGKVTKITNFGVFVELEENLEGLLHVSELSDEKVESPEDVVKVGDELEVRILRVDTVDRKIGLSRKLDAELPPPEAPGTPAAPAVKQPLKGGTGETSGPLFSMGGGTKESEEPQASEE
jgi:small subunit ribosomal protein S1